MITTVLLSALAVFTVGGGIGVVATRNVVYAAIFLLVALVGVAGIFLLLLAEFLALVQILIYGGAITVVLLFAIMLTRGPEQTHVQDNPQRLVAGMASGALFILLATAALATPWREVTPSEDPAAGFTELSRMLFTDYLIPFEIASLVLLVALVGAVVLTRSEREGA